jgi:ABC-type multidrug transport system fused ATPase/permease subunit
MLTSRSRQRAQALAACTQRSAKNYIMERFLDIISRFWPKFYNRITWTVVIAGLALISAPLWEQLITALISKTFDLSSYIPNEPLYGFGLVSLGLFYHLGASVIESFGGRSLSPQQIAAHEHDKALAHKFLEIAREEDVLYHLKMLGSDHSCDDDRRKVLYGIRQFGNLAENEFLDPVIQEVVTNLHSDVDQLTTFITYNFSPMSNSTRTFLYPDLNVDRGGCGSPEERAKYYEYADPMIKLVKSTKDNYLKLRKVLKTQLAI